MSLQANEQFYIPLSFLCSILCHMSYVCTVLVTRLEAACLWDLTWQEDFSSPLCSSSRQLGSIKLLSPNKSFFLGPQVPCININIFLHYFPWNCIISQIFLSQKKWEFQILNLSLIVEIQSVLLKKSWVNKWVNKVNALL